MVIDPNIVMDGPDEIRDAVKDSATDSLSRQVGEPALDEIEPGGAGRNKVKMEARSYGEPSFDVGVLVGSVVVEDQMQVLRRELPVQAAEELQEFLVPVTRHTIGDNRSFQHVEGSKQSGRSMPFIIVSHGPTAPLLHRQARLASIQRLNLTLLIDTHHQGLVRRVQVEPDDIGQLLDKLRIARQLELTKPMRLQPVRVPYPLNRSRTDAAILGHRSTTPVRSSLRFGVQRPVHNLFNFLRSHPRPPAPSFLDFGQACRPQRDEAFAPKNDGRAAESQLFRNLVVRYPFGCHQNDPAPGHHALGRIVSTQPASQSLLLCCGDRQSCGCFPHDPHLIPSQMYCKAICETVH